MIGALPAIFAFGVLTGASGGLAGAAAAAGAGAAGAAIGVGLTVTPLAFCALM